MSGASVFAQDFGALIQRFIDDRGWTHEEVARAVWGAKGADRKGHVSGYINARRGKPSSVTVKGFCEALDIPMSEVDALRVRERAAAAEQAAALDIPLAFLDRMALLFGEDERFPGWAAYEAFLRDKAAHYTRLQSELEALRTSDPRVENRVPAIKDLLAAGEIAEAEAALGDLRDTATDQALEGLRQLSAIMALQAEAALLRNDADAAFALYRDAGALFDILAPEEGANLQYDWAQKLYSQGLSNGGPGLIRSADLWTVVLGFWTKETHPLHWADTQNWIAATYSARGRRMLGDAGLEQMKQAKVIFETVQQVRTRDKHPLLWAVAQNNVGNALSEIGRRSEGATSTAQYAQAIVAYEEALETSTREDSPEFWAMVQSNLGVALLHQGELSDGPASQDLLTRAILRYEAALDVRDRDSMPEQWADTQNNLGYALRLQGQRTPGAPGTALLHRAVETLISASDVSTRRSRPVPWAMTQENLADAYHTIADRCAGADRITMLSKALSAIDGALEVYDPDYFSLQHTDSAKLREKILKEMTRKAED